MSATTRVVDILAELTLMDTGGEHRPASAIRTAHSEERTAQELNSRNTSEATKKVA